jgi:hypothetical protein
MTLVKSLYNFVAFVVKSSEYDPLLSRIPEWWLKPATVAPSFSWQSMALALQIPTQNTQARQIMEREFNTLIQVLMLGRTPRPGRSWRESSTPSSRYKC